MNTHKSMPHNCDAERALLGSILLDNSALNAIAGTVSAADLFADSHRLIFGRMAGLIERGVKVDLITLVEELTKSGELEKAGGASYIAGLSDGVPSGDYAFVENYSRIIRGKSILRQVVNGASSIVSRAFEASDDPIDILADASSSLRSRRRRWIWRTLMACSCRWTPALKRKRC